MTAQPEPVKLTDRLSFRAGVLETPEGHVRLRRLDRGTFATVYRDVDAGAVYAFVNLDIADKGIARLARTMLPGNPHVPTIERLGSTAEQRVYRMPFYRTPLRRQDSVAAWKLHQTLHMCRESVVNSFVGAADSGRQNNIDILQCARAFKIGGPLMQALETMRDIAAECSDSYLFEFQARNLATDAQGNLVLLDILYDYEKKDLQ